MAFIRNPFMGFIPPVPSRLAVEAGLPSGQGTMDNPIVISGITTSTGKAPDTASMVVLGLLGLLLLYLVTQK
jgi:hypothetical protein